MVRPNVLIIAEIGICHNGCLETAKELIQAAKETGADIAKFQLYDVDALFPDKKIMSRGRNWYEEVKLTQLSKEQVKVLADFCKKSDIEFMASCFDLERLGWLEELGVKRHKAASRYVTEELVKAMHDTGKEVLVSIPYGKIEEQWWKTEYADKLLFCIPECPPSKLALNQVDWDVFEGFSDHSIGIMAPLVAVARGAKVIEKHITLDRTDLRGPDHFCSLEPWELEKMVDNIRKIECLMT